MATTPSQAYDHVVVLVAGPLEPHTLQIGATIATGETFNAGALVSLNTAGKVVKGLNADYAMPLWAINGSSDLDVITEGVAYGGGQGISGGQVNCYVATGGYELFTSEYDSATGNTYTANTLLTNGTSSTLGKVTVAASAYNAKAVVGVVSRGVVTDQYGKGTLYFWPTYLPKIVTA
jgi:hypothetical protein